MKYYLIAGEASGDLHGANLMKEIKILDSQAEFRFWGGDLMAAIAGEPVKHYKELAFMGVFEVVANLKTIQRNFKLCEADLLNYQPDVLILIDYPGFNLRMAEFATKNKIKVFYYISPKLWAWNTRRVKKIKRYVDKLFTILPFETDFYKKYSIDVLYSGNPLLDAIDTRNNKDESFETFINRNQLPSKPIVALLAGSRKQEISRILPDMLAMVDKFPNYQFIIAGAPSFSQADYQLYLKNKKVAVLFSQTYELLQQAHAALVTSGTATLETALLNCPQVVCYRMWGGWFTDWAAKKVIIKVPYISLVNLILNREAVKELFQSTFTLESLEHELKQLCDNQEYRAEIFENYNDLKQMMGEPGSSKITARLMLKHLSEI